MKRFLTHATTTAVVLVAATSIAAAGEVGGHNFVVSNPPTTSELPSGITYTSVGNHQVFTTSDSSHPLNRSSGDCNGACVADAEGNTTCMGSCSIVDTDGDLAFFTWDGQNEGHWWLKGGTGKYAKASGQGDWKADAVYAGGITGNSWQGTIDME